jgi:hypothetical protein
MKNNNIPHLRLSDIPLWRLLVALDDAERAFGPDSSTARALAGVIRERLGQEPPEQSAPREVCHE